MSLLRFILGVRSLCFHARMHPTAVRSVCGFKKVKFYVLDEHDEIKQNEKKS